MRSLSPGAASATIPNPNTDIAAAPVTIFLRVNVNVVSVIFTNLNVCCPKYIVNYIPSSDKSSRQDIKYTPNKIIHISAPDIYEDFS